MTFVSPSSLIFVVVLVIWATYLSLHVARRREQMSTARSVDRFSSHMRVLQRRTVRTATSEAETPSSGNTRTSILAAGALEAGEDIDLHPTLAGRAASPAERRTRAARAYLGAVHSNRAFAVWGGLTGMLDELNPRRLRAYALLTFALAGAISFVLAATGNMGWLLPTVCAAGTFAMLAWLRYDRMSVVAARDRRAGAERSADERAEARAQAQLEERERELARQAEAARPEAGQIPVAQEIAPKRVRAAYDFFDLAAFDETMAPAVGRKPAAAGAKPGTATTAVSPAPDTQSERTEPVDPVAEERLWRPVPVPPPTYTLKARADNPMPPALDAPVPIEVEDEFEDALWREDAVGS